MAAVGGGGCSAAADQAPVAEAPVGCEVTDADSQAGSEVTFRAISSLEARPELKKSRKQETPLPPGSAGAAVDPAEHDLHALERHVERGQTLAFPPRPGDPDTRVTVLPRAGLDGPLTGR